jgi:hypothetical protein
MYLFNIGIGLACPVLFIFTLPVRLAVVLSVDDGRLDALFEFLNKPLPDNELVLSLISYT